MMVSCAELRLPCSALLCCAMQVRAEDEEVFEMNPIEYIRRDRCVFVGCLIHSSMLAEMRHWLIHVRSESADEGCNQAACGMCVEWPFAPCISLSTSG